mmetsp:Transcript_1307/g.4636  ORF Transcript_1307/g.4636 Transcript_1307/m.4636 type:complete len:381 (+) Transcript_1307:406-1548(+)
MIHHGSDCPTTDACKLRGSSLQQQQQAQLHHTGVLHRDSACPTDARKLGAGTRAAHYLLASHGELHAGSGKKARLNAWGQDAIHKHARLPMAREEGRNSRLVVLLHLLEQGTRDSSHRGVRCEVVLLARVLCHIEEAERVARDVWDSLASRRDVELRRSLPKIRRARLADKQLPLMLPVHADVACGARYLLVEAVAEAVDIQQQVGPRRGAMAKPRLPHGRAVQLETRFRTGAGARCLEDGWQPIHRMHESSPTAWRDFLPVADEGRPSNAALPHGVLPTSSRPIVGSLPLVALATSTLLVCDRAPVVCREGDERILQHTSCVERAGQVRDAFVEGRKHARIDFALLRLLADAEQPSVGPPVAFWNFVGCMHGLKRKVEE